jgi:hypothetical protein
MRGENRGGGWLHVRGARALLLGSAWAALTAGGCGGGGDIGAWAYVLAPEEPHYGASYGLWSQRWWQWVYELPRTNHPLFDDVGTDAAVGQVNPVWFIGGEIGSLFAPSDGSAERTITIPGGMALFFPILNVSWTNQECVDPDTAYTYTELRQFAADAVESVVDIYCQVDGTTIIDSPDMTGAARFRAQAEEFSYTIPDDNVFVDICGDFPVSVTHDPVASDGIWLMLAPLPPGPHEIRFGGTFPGAPPTFVSFQLDVVYHITVLP